MITDTAKVKSAITRAKAMQPWQETTLRSEAISPSPESTKVWPGVAFNVCDLTYIVHPDYQPKRLYSRGVACAWPRPSNLKPLAAPKPPCPVRLYIYDLWPHLPYHNSDAGVVITYRRTSKGAVVTGAKVVIASMSSYISGPYGHGRGEILLTAPRWEGDYPSMRQARADWRKIIIEAVMDDMTHA